MPLEFGRAVTIFGAAVETVGLTLAILDYWWHQRAKNLELAITNYANLPFKSLWTRIYKLYSGDKPIWNQGGKIIGVSRGEVTLLGALFSIISIAISGWFGRRAWASGMGLTVSATLGIAVTFGTALVIGYGAPLVPIALSRTLRPLARASNGRPIGLFGVMLAGLGFAVSIFHLLEKS